MQELDKNLTESEQILVDILKHLEVGADVYTYSPMHKEIVEYFNKSKGARLVWKHDAWSWVGTENGNESM